MTKTLSTALVELAERVDDESNRRFSSATLRRFINDGCEEVSRRTECLRSSAALTWTSQLQTYTLAANTERLVRINAAQYEPTSDTQVFPLTYMDRRAMDPLWGTHQNISTSAYPEFYTTWGAPPTLEITVAPIPSAAGVLRIYYYRLSTPRSTTGSDDALTLDLPEGWETVALDYAEARCYAKDRNTEGYTTMMQAFSDRLAALAETSVRYSDNPGQIIPDFSGLGYGQDDGMYW